MSGPTSPPRPGADAYRVPVEHRFLGLDKRSFPFAFIVLALWLLMHLALPHLNEAYDTDDATVAGDRMLVTESLAFTPGTDWQVELGLRTSEPAVNGPETVELTKGGVVFLVQPDDFDGDPSELLDQITRVAEATDPGAFKPVTSRSTVTTESGITGISETIEGPNATARLLALVDDGTGIEIQVAGPTDQMDQLADEIDQMISSLGPLDTTQEQS